MDPKIFEKMELREGDVFISTGAKQGTTWNCYIVQQLLSNCNNDFKYLLDVVPWAEFVYYPGQQMEERLELLEHMPRNQRRAFKTHMCPPALPLDPRVKYVICVRDPTDSAVSIYHFINAHTDEFYNFWQFPPKMNNWQEFTGFITQADFYWDFVNSWWPHRGDKNVFMVHYSELKNKPEETIRKMAEFLEVPLSDSQLRQVVTNVSFENMKRSEEKFETILIGKNKDIHGIMHGGMMRKGEILKGKEAPEELLETYHKICEARCLNKEQLEWCRHGGHLPA